MEDAKIKKIRTLIVDDSLDFLEVEKGFLSMESHIEIIGEALNGEQSVELAAKLKPDLVLMDFVLPDMTGVDATKKIKEMENPPFVVILTLYDNPEYKNLAEKSGADGFVIKSEFATKLIPLINKLFFENYGDKEMEQIKMPNILIVDDSATMRRMIMACLNPIEGAKFIEVSNGLEAIEQIAIGNIDLITLDLNMPDVHGLEVLNFLKQHERFRNIPVIVVTTKKDEASREAAINAGASIYMTKPFRPEELLNNALKLLKKKKKIDSRSNIDGR
ncbi:MAG: response regulator [Syntrophorhabdaceae bacterium]|nr:response regulator [Syntrophorhabdaceae bacterium]